jgi:hypothetical protein
MSEIHALNSRSDEGSSESVWTGTTTKQVLNLLVLQENLSP